MVLLREVLSIVLLFAPAEAQTGHPPRRDVHVISLPGDYTAVLGRGLYAGETINAGGYAWTFVAPFECTRLALRPSLRVRSAAWGFQPAGEAGQNRFLFPLIKGALRLVTGYIDAAARTDYKIPAKIVTVGIRG